MKVPWQFKCETVSHLEDEEDFILGDIINMDSAAYSDVFHKLFGQRMGDAAGKPVIVMSWKCENRGGGVR